MSGEGSSSGRRRAGTAVSRRPPDVQISTTLNYNKDNGVGYYSFTREEGITLSRQSHAETFENPQKVYRYLTIMRELVHLSHPYILSPLGCYPEKNMLWTESYAFTMLEVVKGIGEKLWVGQEKTKSHRMSPQLQAIIKKIAEGIQLLIKFKATFKITLESIVFCSKRGYLVCNDYKEAFKGEVHPKIRNIWDAQEEADSSLLWNGLADCILEMIRISKIIVDVEVTEFLKMLQQKRLNNDKVKRHPALMSSSERLDFIAAIRDIFFRMDSSITFDLVHPLKEVAKDWSKTVQSDIYLKVIYQYNEEGIKERAKESSDCLCLVYFVRDCDEHVNDKKYLDQHGLQRLSKEELGSKINVMFPGFYSYVFHSYVDSRHHNDAWVIKG